MGLSSSAIVEEIMQIFLKNTFILRLLALGLRSIKAFWQSANTSSWEPSHLSWFPITIVMQHHPSRQTFVTSFSTVNGFGYFLSIHFPPSKLLNVQNLHFEKKKVNWPPRTSKISSLFITYYICRYGLFIFQIYFNVFWNCSEYTDNCTESHLCFLYVNQNSGSSTLYLKHLICTL